MLIRLTRAALILTLCASLGGQWIALQSVAWTRMIVQYSQHTSLARAVAQTFDGAHPCDLCKGIAAAKQSEKKSDATPLKPAPDLLCVTRAIVLLPPWTDFSFVKFGVDAAARADSPPTPPPRRALA